MMAKKTGIKRIRSPRLAGASDPISDHPEHLAILAFIRIRSIAELLEEPRPDPAAARILARSWLDVYAAAIDELRRSLPAIVLVLGLAAACQADDDQVLPDGPSSSSTEPEPGETSGPGTPRRPLASGVVQDETDPGQVTSDETDPGQVTSDETDPGQVTSDETETDTGTGPGTQACSPGGTDCATGTTCCSGGCGSGGSCSLDHPGIGPVSVCCW